MLVVLGAPPAPDGSPGPVLGRRIGWALELYRRGDVDWMIATGGIRHRPPAEAESEAEVIARGLAAGGVPATRILLEPAARSTWDNARLAAALIRSRGLADVVLVTDRWHQPRARLAFRVFGIHTRPLPPGLGWRRTSAARLAVTLLRELIALPWYGLRAAGLRLGSARRR